MSALHIITNQGSYCHYSDLLATIYRLRAKGKTIITIALPDTIEDTKITDFLQCLRADGDLLIALVPSTIHSSPTGNFQALLKAVDYLMLIENIANEALLAQLSPHQHYTATDNFNFVSTRDFSTKIDTYDHDAFATFLKGAELFEQFARSIYPLASTTANRIATTIAAGNKLLVCGNGGSAADAQHFVAEMVGRYLCERNGWPAIALTVDSSVLTSIANDYGFSAIFSRQVQALGKAGDILMAISTSGKSPNILSAAKTARENNIYTIALTGEGETPLSAICDITLSVPSSYTPHIQQAHIAVIHLLCELIEKQLSAANQ